jgi:hypothetical protein
MKNCRFAPIDARVSSVNRPRVGIHMQTRVALQHSPGEGPGGSS